MEMAETVILVITEIAAEMETTIPEAIIMVTMGAVIVEIPETAGITIILVMKAIMEKVFLTSIFRHLKRMRSPSSSTL